MANAADKWSVALLEIAAVAEAGPVAHLLEDLTATNTDQNFPPGLK